MATYILTYHGHMASRPADPAEAEAKWGSWYKSLGDKVVDPGAPFGEATSVTPDGKASDAPAAMTGYTIVTADDMAEAQTMALGCPVLEHGHTVQINQAIDIT